MKASQVLVSSLTLNDAKIASIMTSSGGYKVITSNVPKKSFVTISMRFFCKNQPSQNYMKLP